MLSARRVLAICVHGEHCTLQNFAEGICKIYMEIVGCKLKTKTTPCLLAQRRSMMALFTRAAEGWNEEPC